MLSLTCPQNRKPRELSRDYVVDWVLFDHIAILLCFCFFVDYVCGVARLQSWASVTRATGRHVDACQVGFVQLNYEIFGMLKNRMTQKFSFVMWLNLMKFYHFLDSLILHFGNWGVLRFLLFARQSHEIDGAKGWSESKHQRLFFRPIIKKFNLNSICAHFMICFYQIRKRVCLTIQIHGHGAYNQSFKIAHLCPVLFQELVYTIVSWLHLLLDSLWQFANIILIWRIRLVLNLGHKTLHEELWATEHYFMLRSGILVRIVLVMHLWLLNLIILKLMKPRIHIFVAGHLKSIFLTCKIIVNCCNWYGYIAILINSLLTQLRLLLFYSQHLLILAFVWQIILMVVILIMVSHFLDKSVPVTIWNWIKHLCHAKSLWIELFLCVILTNIFVFFLLSLKTFTLHIWILHMFLKILITLQSLIICYWVCRIHSWNRKWQLLLLIIRFNTLHLDLINFTCLRILNNRMRQVIFGF